MAISRKKKIIIGSVAGIAIIAVLGVSLLAGNREAPEVTVAKVKQQALLAASDVEWVLVRPPRLHDGAGTGSPRATLDDVASSSLSRHDLAAFCLAEAIAPKFSRRAPFLST